MKSTDEKKGSIILIEDDRLISRAYIQGLKQHGYNITAAQTGSAGLNKIITENPDIVLLDLMLPDIPGEQVLKIMKEKGILNKIPVIVLTNKADDANVNNCVNVWGASDYLIKSDYTLDGVARKIEKCLKNNRRMLRK